MEKQTVLKPKPGSPKARRIGCTCSLRENNRGKGVYCPPEFGLTRIAWWVDWKCPVHRTDVNKIAHSALALAKKKEKK
jgi:hypothetical protein